MPHITFCLIVSKRHDLVSVSTNKATDEESSPSGITIHLPGLPVTADCPMAETEEVNSENDNWSDMGNPSFHGFTPEEVEEQRRNNELHR